MIAKGLGVIAGVVLLGVADARAQEYPQKPISVVVPFAAGARPIPLRASSAW